MTDYEYILKQARKFHYSQWTDEELRKCFFKKQEKIQKDGEQ